jgi:hypothetical protein
MFTNVSNRSSLDRKETNMAANVLSGAIGWLVEFVREVDRGIAVGYGFELPEKVRRRECGGLQARRSAGCGRRKTGK